MKHVFGGTLYQPHLQHNQLLEEATTINLKSRSRFIRNQTFFLAPEFYFSALFTKPPTRSGSSFLEPRLLGPPIHRENI